MCNICDNNYGSNDSVLECENCDGIRVVPTLYGIKELIIRNCRNLKYFNTNDEIEILSISDSDMLSDLEKFGSLKTLKLMRCNSIKKIPSYDNLEELDCYGCDQLSVLGTYPKLNTLLLQYNQSMDVIPEYTGLTKKKIYMCCDLNKNRIKDSRKRVNEILETENMKEWIDNNDRLELQKQKDALAAGETYIPRLIKSFYEYKNIHGDIITYY